MLVRHHAIALAIDLVIFDGTGVALRALCCLILGTHLDFSDNVARPVADFPAGMV